MCQCFVDHLPRDAIDEALCNTLRVAEKVEPYNLFGATRIPDFPIPNNFYSSHDDYLRHVAQLGLQERLKARIKSSLISKGSERTYIERLDLELGMIRRMGFSSYFLVVWDYIRFARTNDIPVGPGRGSAAGSLVAFALRITDVDPIPFNLLFERFLNIERKSMPDIDTDFSVDGREKVIAYVTERYSQSRVAQIITFNRLTSKAVLKDVARVHNVSYKEADRLAKLIPVSRGKPATLKDLLSKKPSSKDFKTAVEGHPEYREWLDKAQRIEGTNKTFGIHAAGVVISANPLTDIVPLRKRNTGKPSHNMRWRMSSLLGC
ncbi:DNA polymerase III alpha subunit [Gracilaria domingensis]|nr:DNA polymerase III alpha subunit [Gracilaria domingensis]